MWSSLRHMHQVDQDHDLPFLPSQISPSLPVDQWNLVLEYESAQTKLPMPCCCFPSSIVSVGF